MHAHLGLFFVGMMTVLSLEAMKRIVVHPFRVPSYHELLKKNNLFSQLPRYAYEKEVEYFRAESRDSSASFEEIHASSKRSCTHSFVVMKPEFMGPVETHILYVRSELLISVMHYQVWSELRKAYCAAHPGEDTLIIAPQSRVINPQTGKKRLLEACKIAHALHDSARKDAASQRWLLVAEEKGAGTALQFSRQFPGLFSAALLINPCLVHCSTDKKKSSSSLIKKEEERRTIRECFQENTVPLCIAPLYCSKAPHISRDADFFISAASESEENAHLMVQPLPINDQGNVSATLFQELSELWFHFQRASYQIKKAH